MDPLDKYVSQEALEYFITLTDGRVVGKNEEVTDPNFANENNIIVIWGGGTKIKCVAPSEVDYDTKFIYLGTNIFYNSPESITVTNNTSQTIVFGTNSTQTLARTRSSSSDPWPSTFNTLNSDPLWDESGKRTQKVVQWYKSNGETGAYDQISAQEATSGNQVGSLSPPGWLAGDMLPTYGYY